MDPTPLNVDRGKGITARAAAREGGIQGGRKLCKEGKVKIAFIILEQTQAFFIIIFLINYSML